MAVIKTNIPFTKLTNNLEIDIPALQESASLLVMLASLDGNPVSCDFTPILDYGDFDDNGTIKQVEATDKTVSISNTNPAYHLSGYVRKVKFTNVSGDGVVKVKGYDG